MKRTVQKIIQSLQHLPELLLAFILPAAGQLGIVVLAVLTDTATGVWAARKSREKINYRRFSDIVTKLITYLLLILMARAVEDVFQINHALTLVTMLLVGLELGSVDENFQKATGKKGLLKPFIDLFKRK
jgi:Bacteriophage holin family